MSEYLNSQGSPVFQADMSGHSIHISDLSPTSELLLSPLHSSTEGYRVYEGYEKDRDRAPTDFPLKQRGLSSKGSASLVNLASQYNDVQSTEEPKPGENHKKAFSHEKLYAKTHKPLRTTISEPRNDFAKRNVTSQKSGQELSYIATNANPDYQNTKPSSSLVALDNDLLFSSFRTSGLNDSLLNPYDLLNGNRYGSLISKSSLNNKGYVGGWNADINHGHGEVYRGTVNENGDQTFDGGMKGLISDKVQIKVNDNNYQGEKLDSLTNENSRFDVVTSTTEDSNSYGNVIFDGQGYTTMSNGNTNSLNPGDMPLNSFLTAGSTLSDNANGKPEGDSLTGLNDRGLLTNSRMNTLDYGDFRPNNNDWNRKMTLADSEDIPKSGNRSGLFSELPQTTEDVLSQIFGRTVVSDKLKETMFTELPESGRNNSLKRSDLAQHGVTHDPPVQTNVPNYYGKLKKSANGNSFRETDVGLMQTTFGPRRGMRSKSSELPLRKNANVSKSFGLSKSWGSSKSRQEFQATKRVEREDEARERSAKENVSQTERIAKMFRIEEEMNLKRAQDLCDGKLSRKIFTAWRMRAQDIKTKADKLCKMHLLRKGMNALRYSVECQRQVVREFEAHRGSIVLAKYWRMWQQRTRESERKKKQQTFTQWHYYKLHMERANLLDTIANKHILSKNYSKWKARFNAQQKNSIATVHFKINLIYRYWQCWTLYAGQRRVKNHLNSVASYHYGERSQGRFLKEWRNRTQKSLLAGRLARRRILLKAFFEWKHWTHYAKIVHLRLRSMCKEYHKKSVLTRTLTKWRQTLRMKQSLAFWKKNQLRRTLKLWKLRHMRKKIHKHLCKALAKKARKRRFFEKWSRWVEIQKQTRSTFTKLIQDFYVRVLFNSWRNEARKGAMRRQSLWRYQHEKSIRVVQQCWEFWKFQVAIMELRKRSENSRSLRCVKKCCEVWKLKVKKVKLGIMLDQNCSIWELLFMKRFFRIWRGELEKAKVAHARSLFVANILRKNSLARVFQAWRVVNQEECIIESLVKRRERKEMAKVYDAWRHYLFRVKHIRQRQLCRVGIMKRSTFGIWRQKAWSITKEREVAEALLHSKLQRYFLAWMEHVKDVHLTEKMREKRAADVMRHVIQTWKQNAAKKAESREREIGERAYCRVLLTSFFGAWQRKTKEQSQILRIMEEEADSKNKYFILEKSLKKWIRQFTIGIKTKEYLEFKRTDRLRKMFLGWKDFANDEFERQLHDFATNLALDSSVGSAFLSPSSGYQTSLKNSAASFQFLPGDEEDFAPHSAPHSRPTTPTRCLNGTRDKLHMKSAAHLPIYRPVTMDRQPSFPGYQTPPLTTELQSGRCRSPLIRQRSLDQISQVGTSPQRSSEDDDGVPSSGVHSAGEESDQDDRTSVHITESIFSFQTTSDGTPRDRELLVTDTILHWRSLPLSVAFRSWYKYTQHTKLVTTLYSDCVIRNRERLLTKMLDKWRRWLFVCVLARQHWLMQVRKKYLLVWAKYRKQEILNAQRKDEAEEFSQRSLRKRYFMKWKSKKTTKCHLQSIVGRWQRDAVVTDTDKFVIQQFKRKNQANCLRRTFLYWRKMAVGFQVATQFCETLSIRRCLSYWRSVVCYQAELRRKVNWFRNSHLMSKTFKEWLLRFKDNRTAKSLLEVSEERKVEKIFNAWRVWASATSQRRKTSLCYRRLQELRKSKIKFTFWLTAVKKRRAVREHYEKTLQKRVLKSWRDVLMLKASNSGSIQDFQKIVQRNTLQASFAFWRKRAQQNQLLSEYLEVQAKRKLASGFERWRKQKRKSKAKVHFSQRLKKKSFSSWRKEISRRRKARQHFKSWHAIAEGNKELNQVADVVIHDSEIKLLMLKFGFWKNATRHVQVAKYHHSTKLARRLFIEWLHYTRSQKRLSLKLKEFQLSHQRNDLGLLEKHMKIWMMKSASSTLAENLHNHKISSKHWKVWRHNFVRRRVSSAMAEHDEKKTLSKVFIAWYNITASHKSLSKEVKTFCLRRWFRHWMTRYNNS